VSPRTSGDVNDVGATFHNRGDQRDKVTRRILKIGVERHKMGPGGYRGGRLKRCALPKVSWMPNDYKVWVTKAFQDLQRLVSTSVVDDDELDGTGIFGTQDLGDSFSDSERSLNAGISIESFTWTCRYGCSVYLVKGAARVVGKKRRTRGRPKVLRRGSATCSSWKTVLHARGLSCSFLAFFVADVRVSRTVWRVSENFAVPTAPPTLEHPSRGMAASLRIAEAS